jgi:hypothetical protein
MEKDATPAWMVCDDILTRIKDELILEAIDILHDEINSKHLVIEGYSPVVLERSEEMQRDIYLINNLMERAEEISTNYGKYLDGSAAAEVTDPLRVEELKRFLMSISGIRFLMDTAKVFESWSADTGKYYSEKDPSSIIKKTMGKGTEREKALEYILKSKKIIENEAITKEERSILDRAYELNKGV